MASSPPPAPTTFWQYFAWPFDSSFYCFPSMLFFSWFFLLRFFSWFLANIHWVQPAKKHPPSFNKAMRLQPKSNALNNTRLLKVCWVSEWLISHYTVPVASQQRGCRGRKLQRHKMTERRWIFFFFFATLRVCFALKHIESNISSKTQHFKTT